MYILTTSASFDSAHFLSGYIGKCSNIHGHRWIVTMEIGQEFLCEDLQDRGMVVDFSKLKSDLKLLTDKFDHSLIIENGSLKEGTLNALKEEGFSINCVDFRPTAEKFSEYFYKEMQEKGYKVIKVTVNETPDNSASYSV